MTFERLRGAGMRGLTESTFGRITFNPDVMEGQPCVLGLTVVSIIRLRLDPDWGDERIRADGVDA